MAFEKNVKMCHIESTGGNSPAVVSPLHAPPVASIAIRLLTAANHGSPVGCCRWHNCLAMNRVKRC